MLMESRSSAAASEIDSQKLDGATVRWVSQPARVLTNYILY